MAATASSRTTTWSRPRRILRPKRGVKGGRLRHDRRGRCQCPFWFANESGLAALPRQKEKEQKERVPKKRAPMAPLSLHRLRNAGRILTPTLTPSNTFRTRPDA